MEKNNDDRGPAAAQTDAAEVAARQLLVRFEDALSTEQIDEINRRLGTVVINRMSGGKLLLVEVPYVGTLNDIMAAYAATPGVRYAEPNQVVTTQPGAETPAPDSPPPGQGEIKSQGTPD